MLWLNFLWNLLRLLVTFIAITVSSYEYMLKSKHSNFIFWVKVVFTKFYSASLSTQTQPPFIFLQSEGGSDINTLELSN